MILYQWKEEALPYTMLPNSYTLGVPISSSQGVVTIPFRKSGCKIKGSGRRWLTPERPCVSTHYPQRYNQTYPAAAYSSRPRFLTPIPKATQTISDSVHVNLSCASVSVSSIFYTNTRSLVNKMDETDVILSQTDTQIFIVRETWFHSELPDSDVNIPPLQPVYKVTPR